MFLLPAISWLESVGNDALRQWLVFPGWVETGIPGSNYGKRSEHVNPHVVGQVFILQMIR